MTDAMDTLFHTAFAILMAAIFLAMYGLFGINMASVLISAFVIFFREVTQEQSKRYDYDIRYGWNFFKWSTSKNMETWIPIAIVILTGLLIEYLT